MSRTNILVFILAIVSTLILFKSCSAEAENNGFDLKDSMIAPELILPGGPDKDGIPAIDEPKFIPASAAGGLAESDMVLSLTLNGVTRAYPIAILNWHEIVNDKVENTPVVVSYCPLCGTGMAFLPEVGGQALSFGVSGLLYNSDVLLYDRESESLWSQLKGQAISGKYKGRKLTQVPLMLITWGDWQARYPEGKVLSQNTGYFRDYNRSPYGQYENSPLIYFPVEFRSQAFHPKERVLGIEIEGQFKAYPFAELAKLGKSELTDSFNNRVFKVRFDAQKRTGEIIDMTTNTPLPSVNAFWFAWYTFNPETEIYRAP